MTRQKKKNLNLGSEQSELVNKKTNSKMAYIHQSFTEPACGSTSPPSSPASEQQSEQEPDMAKFYMSEYMLETMKMLYMMR